MDCWDVFYFFPEVLIIMVANLPIVTSLSDIMFIGLLFCLMLLLSLRFELVTFNCFLLFLVIFCFCLV
jgi:hypothetical protein